MDVLRQIDDMLPRILDGFTVTVRLAVLSLVLSTIIGTALASMRVSPVAPLRAFGTAYVNVFRNTPLVVLFIFVVEGFPQLGIQPKLAPLGMDVFEMYAVIALSGYTAAFVCEAVRSGINTVAAGQAEAARAIGLTFEQTLREVILPQAFRAVVPPLVSVYIACTKNSAIAAAFGVLEATAQLSSLIEDFPGSVYLAFLLIAAGYMVLVFVLAGVSALVERHFAVSR